MNMDRAHQSGIPAGRRQRAVARCSGADHEASRPVSATDLVPSSGRCHPPADVTLRRLPVNVEAQENEESAWVFRAITGWVLKTYNVGYVRV